ncbi:MAG: zf-TFIIB domain-containing protein [Phycisphaerales bacterium]|nr:zf-TFIIB domain-containing protein [Phycisphaerales bacterium]
MADVPVNPGAPDPDEVGNSSGTLACPKCESAMQRVRVNEIEIDRCAGCGGLWLDALEKDKLIADRAAALAADTGDAKVGKELDSEVLIHCPRDRSRMIHMVDRRQGHVGFESCKVCGGVFLDAGELRDLAHHSIFEKLRSLFSRA